jgi:hypothetical protein
MKKKQKLYNVNMKILMAGKKPNKEFIKGMIRGLNSYARVSGVEGSIESIEIKLDK